MSVGLQRLREDAATIRQGAVDKGCVLDTDGDGVPDANDRCPTVKGPAELEGCPDRDSDGDGLRDDLDECPSESSGGHEDHAHPGCPLPDRDRDGVPNDEDFCPDVPSNGNDDSLREGCPLAH